MLTSCIYRTPFINALEMCVLKILFSSADSVMLDKENIITPQGLHGGIRPLMKRRLLAALNGKNNPALPFASTYFYVVR